VDCGDCCVPTHELKDRAGATVWVMRAAAERRLLGTLFANDFGFTSFEAGPSLRFGMTTLPTMPHFAKA
jgi:hypothetical protein